MEEKNRVEREILEDIRREEHEVRKIKTNIDYLRHKLIEQDLDHFSSSDINHAFFGALIIGLTFVFKGLLIEIGMQLPWQNVLMIVIATLLILTSEIYYVGYARVKHKERRPFFQFWLKRLTAMYVIAIVVSFFLLYLFGFMMQSDTPEHFMKLVFVVAMPCAIGTAIPSMLNPQTAG